MANTTRPRRQWLVLYMWEPQRTLVDSPVLLPVIALRVWQSFQGHRGHPLALYATPRAARRAIDADLLARDGTEWITRDRDHYALAPVTLP